MSDLPALTGRQLIRLLMKDGWQESGRTRHGVALRKPDARGRVRIAVVPDKNESLGDTIHRIASVKQTSLGRKGLEALLRKYGLS